MRVVIFAGGTYQPGTASQKALANADMLIAADSGAATALHLGYVPTYIVGDFDSLDTQLVEQLRQVLARMFEERVRGASGRGGPLRELKSNGRASGVLPVETRVAPGQRRGKHAPACVVSRVPVSAGLRLRPQLGQGRPALARLGHVRFVIRALTTGAEARVGLVCDDRSARHAVPTDDLRRLQRERVPVRRSCLG